MTGKWVVALTVSVSVCAHDWLHCWLATSSLHRFFTFIALSSLSSLPWWLFSTRTIQIVLKDMFWNLFFRQKRH